jgi:transposase
MPKKFVPEIKSRAVRMVRDHLPEYGSVTTTAEAVGPQLGISRDTLRRWVAQADVDDGRRAGVSIDPVDLRHYLGTSYWPKRW